jgi:hypothetical protein
LEVIQDNLRRLSDSAAERLPARLIDRTAMLGVHPQMGRTIPEFRNPLLRELIEGAIDSCTRCFRTESRSGVSRMDGSSS